MTRLQVRRGLAAAWTASNTRLSSGEFGYETDTKKLKIGDGSTEWISLPYFESSALSGSSIVSLINASASLIDDDNIASTISRTSHTHGNVTNTGYIGSTANLPIITGTSGILQAGAFGTTSGTFCAGDDTRLVTNAKQADRPFVFQTGHTAWATGLSNEEIGRIQLQTGETLYIKRVEMQIKGGGTSASLSVNAYDATNVASIASQTAGGVNTTGGNSGSAALVLIRLTNSVGSTQNANVYISGWIRS